MMGSHGDGGRRCSATQARPAQGFCVTTILFHVVNNVFLPLAQLVAGMALLLLDSVLCMRCRWISKIGGARSKSPLFMVHSSWDDALFLHWEVPADDLRRLLPIGLEPDLLNGKAYVGLVLLTESGIRPAWSVFDHPSLSITHLAANVRTYVRPVGQPNATPGVYFFSLDASSWLASAGAYVLFGLPYHPSAMRRDWDHPDQRSRCRFSSRRWHRATPSCSEPLSVLYAFEGHGYSAMRKSSSYNGCDLSSNMQKEHGQDEDRVIMHKACGGNLSEDVRARNFLIERYCLYHCLPFRSTLSIGQISHAPWKLANRAPQLLDVSGVGCLMEAACPGLLPIVTSEERVEFPGNLSMDVCAGDTRVQAPDTPVRQWDTALPNFVHFGSVETEITFGMFKPVSSK